MWWSQLWFSSCFLLDAFDFKVSGTRNAACVLETLFYLFPYSWHTTWHWFQVHNTGSPHLWRSGSAHKCGCHLSPYNAICQKSFFFFFNRGLRRERKDSARTFSANCVYYCCHFAHFSFLSVKLRKLKWFPKYLEVFGSQRLKTIADFGSMQFLPDLTHCWQYLEILSIFYLV